MIVYYKDFCAQDKHLYANGIHNLITVYDDHEYDRSDFEVLNGSQRKYIVDAFCANGHAQKSGKTMRHSKLGYVLEFCQSPSLGVNSLIQLERSYDQDKMWIVPPTTLALFILLHDQGHAIDQLKDLIASCPINIKKMIDVSVHEDYHQFLMKNAFELQLYQKEIVSQKFARKKPL